ncbi:MAG: four helix bundle protein [Fibrobacter sp.]|nr:four helix bundle protein [Fibrobacter sp.]
MINIHSVNGYMRLHSWVFGNVLQLGTQEFCKRFVDYKIDPCGRLRDQMEMAARTVPANIAEGSSRHQTSYETELRLLDVARASVSELEGDLLNWLMRSRQTMWSTADQRYATLLAIQLEEPNYSQDLLADVSQHILRQYALFAPFVEVDDAHAAACALLVICERVKQLLTGQINKRLADFKDEGGFTENMTQERLNSVRQAAQQEGAPQCPICSAPMRKMMAKKGKNAGKAFWGCSNYPNCNGTLKIEL